MDQNSSNNRGAGRNNGGRDGKRGGGSKDRSRNNGGSRGGNDRKSSRGKSFGDSRSNDSFSNNRKDNRNGRDDRGHSPRNGRGGQGGYGQHNDRNRGGQNGYRSRDRRNGYDNRRDDRGYGSRNDRDNGYRGQRGVSDRRNDRGYGRDDRRNDRNGYGNRRDDRGSGRNDRRNDWGRDRNDRNRDGQNGYGQHSDRNRGGQNGYGGRDRRNDRNGYDNRRDDRGYGSRDDRGGRNGQNGYGNRGHGRNDRYDRKQERHGQDVTRDQRDQSVTSGQEQSGATRKNFGFVARTTGEVVGHNKAVTKDHAAYGHDKRRDRKESNDNRNDSDGRFGRRDERGGYGNRGSRADRFDRNDGGSRRESGFGRNRDRFANSDRYVEDDEREGRFGRGGYGDVEGHNDRRNGRTDSPGIRRNGDRRPYSGPNPDRRTPYSRDSYDGSGRRGNGGSGGRGSRGRDRIRDERGSRGSGRFDGYKTHKELRMERQAEREQFGEDAQEFFASCAFGFEAMLGQELEALGCQGVRPLQGGVAFYGDEECAYRVCLWSRLASRVLLVLDRFGARDAEELYENAKEITWGKYLDPDGTFAINTRGTNRELRNTAFVAQKVKDAICDRMRAKQGRRPNVQPDRPDLNIRVTIHGNSATLYIDYAGEPLNQRSYRTGGEAVEAPLKESLAASVLAWAGWTADDKRAFFDPCCGSGTFVIEAAMMACDKAPGLLRDYWGFQGLRTFQSEVWDRLIEEAERRFEAGLESPGLFMGSDIDPRAVEAATSCAKKAGLAEKTRFVVADCAEMRSTLEAAGFDFQDADASAFLAINPPYGQRLMSEGLGDYYAQLREGLTSLPAGWDVAVITADELFDTEVGIDAQESTPFYNGNIEVTGRLLTTGSTFFSECSFVDLAGNDVTVTSTSEHVDQFAARFRKVAKARKKWAASHALGAFRIYDADLPDYAVAIDLYVNAENGEENLLITEYQAPSEIDPQQAARRFNDACTVAGAMLGIPEERVFTRVRHQARGGSQYARDERVNRRILVQEDGHLFEVDLEGYLDTGLFLDHRITRKLVGEMASDKRFLNLFAYTGSATVYAAAGGASSTTTVDLSQTYLEWACDNMERAGFDGDEHEFIRTDVLGWLEGLAQAMQPENGEEPTGQGVASEQAAVEADVKHTRAEAAIEHAGAEAAAEHAGVEAAVDDSEGLFDLVFFDAPTFSNSKSMGERTWDIQRDYLDALGSLRKLLPLDARVVFSGNYRRFKLDVEAVREAGFTVKDITQQTIPEDFLRNPRIHFCYVLRAV